LANYYEDCLQTPRFHTRPLTIADVPAWTAFFEDKEAVELFPDLGIKTSQGRAEYWIQRQIWRYENEQYGLKALIEPGTDALIGQCGLLIQEVDGVKELEVGYHIYKKNWGQGFAPEAAKLFMNYAFANKLSDSIISIIDVRNIKSQRVAEKNGLHREKQTNWSGRDVYIYRISSNKI
jgi:RimJ/RimL family protein N-acetyltransferase